MTEATLEERFKVGEMIADVKAKAHFYYLSMKEHPLDSFHPLNELLLLANGLQAAAELAPEALEHPFPVVRLYALQRLRRAGKIMDIEIKEVNNDAV